MRPEEGGKLAALHHKSPGHPKLPSHSHKEIIKRLRKLGMETVVRKGARHPLKVRWPGGFPIPIPVHNPVSKGTLKGILSAAGLTLDQYLNAK